MNTYSTDIRPAKLTDLPLIHRLAADGLTLDMQLACTREGGALGAAARGLLVPSLVRQHDIYTLVGRANRQPVMAQYRLKADDHLAQILALAPQLPPDADDSAWLHIVDALTMDAGRHGAHMLTAEVDEATPLFCTMRQAGFAVYARQEIYRAASAAALQPAPPLAGTLHEETDADAMDVQLLYANIVPRLVQPISVPSADSTGLVYRHEGRILGYIAVSVGRSGIYVVPFLHPDVLGREATAALSAVLTGVASRADRLPVYVCVRRYQEWLEESLYALGMQPAAAQAVMVRHIAIGIRQPQFARVNPAMRVAHALTPPVSSIDLHQTTPHTTDSASHGATH